ncbi:autotransporter-associated N-terminal domain-containing protein [Fusobacterium sp. THCT1E2]
MRKGDIEKSLKRFLKRKVSYSFALLIAFMITGGISLGAEITAEEIQESKGDLLSRIQTEREEIKRKIAENERLIKEYNSNFVELVRKGDFYSKPLFNSTQVFFSYQHLDSGKMKDVTDKEFSETIDAINKHYGTRSGRSILKSTGNIGKDKLIAGNGVAVDTEVFRETIEVGANIKPVEPVLPEINPNVSVNVSAPTITLGGLPSTVAPIVGGIGTITAPTLGTIIPPSEVSVSVATPAAVDKITVSVPVVTTPVTPAEKNITVSAPTAPGGFTPTAVTAPTAPEAPTVAGVTIPTIIIPNLQSPSSGNSDGSWAWNTGGENGLISQVIATSGDFIFTTGGSGSYDDFTAGVTGYTATAASGYNVSVNNATYGPELVSGSKAGMYRIIGSRYSSFGVGTTITINATARPESGSALRQFIHFDPHGDRAAATINDITEASNAEKTQATNLVNKYKGAHSNFEDKGYQILALNGKLTINGNTMVGVGLQGHSNSGRNPMILHTGTTVINGNKNVVFAYPNATDGANRLYITTNYGTGKIEINGNNNFVMLSEKNYTKHVHNFENSGIIDIKTGNNNIGFFGKQGINNGYLDLQKPITISSTGTENIGVYQANASNNKLNENSVIKVDMLNGNKNVGYVGDYSSQIINTNVYNIIGGTNNIGVISNNTLTLNGLTLNISGGDTNFGLVNKVGTLSSNGAINISGGNDNIGIANQSTGIATHTGNIILSAGGTNNIGVYGDTAASTTITGKIQVNGEKNKAVYGKNSHTISVNNITADTTDSIVIYGESGAKITVNDLNVVSKTGANPTTINKKDTGAAFAKGTGTIITINRTLLPNGANINITGAKLNDADRYVGFGLMAADGGVINAKNNYIKVTNGSTAVASIGANSNVDLSGGTVEFDGSGYAVYSDGVGKIDLSSAKLILGGSSTAFDLDLTEGVTSPIKLNSNSKINVVSNNVVVFNLKNVKGLNTNDLQKSITDALGTAIGEGINLDKLLQESTATGYKTAAVDGGEIAIGDLDKTGTAGETDPAKTAGNFYYNRFLGQRLKATATGSTISAVLNNEQAGKYNNQVVGLEMNSSKNAKSNTETAIILKDSSTIIADRTEAGAGAIGAYINYGIVEVDGNSSIKVEKENNPANDKAVGIYAVNGSKVTNAGTIDVGGSQSIGILGMAYRETLEGTVVGAEYGNNAAGQGKVNITNTGNINLDGTGTIGIYVNNNNSVGVVADNIVTNNTSGTITVGNSDNSAAAIGIYGKKAEITNRGNITVGSGGVAIYATAGSNVTELGILNLGSDGIGVMIDGTSTITANSVTLTSVGADINGKTGIFYKGTAIGSDSQDINLTIDASGFVKGTAVYVQDMDVKSSGNLTVGTEGIGIFVAKTDEGVAISRTGTNKGTIKLGASEKAIGIYGKDTNIANDAITGIINVGHSSQIGMYADGTNGKVTNIGAINLKIDGATGIYVRDGATADISGDNIKFDGKSSIGVYAEGAKVNFTDTFTFQNDNANKNIYVYGKGATVGITSGKIVTIDGRTAGTLGDKTVGIYLENAGSGSTFNGTGNLTVKNGAVGIYSKGDNTLKVNITAEGDKTTGVFIDGASTISGTVTAKTDAIGVYGSGNETGKAVTIGTGGLTLNTNSGKGTGMYLTDGAYATEGKITVNNSSTDNNIGVYYSKGTASEIVRNESAIELTGSNSVGIYAADGITLENNSNITSTTLASNSIALYVGGSSTLTSNGTIELKDTANGIGIYVESGKGINSASGEVKLTATIGSMVGIASKGTGASIENRGKITVGNNLGMYIAEGSSGKNSGNITVEKGATTTGTGVYIEGAGNSFDGTNGTITSDAVGIYLKDTTAGTVANTGTLSIASGGVGVFGKDANIDFDVNVMGDGAIGVAASGNSVISGNIKTEQDSVGVYILDNDVTFAGADITTGNKNGGTSVGILFDSSKQGTYIVNNVKVDAKNGVGIYLDGTSGTTLAFGGTVTTAGTGAVGIYVKAGTALNSNNSLFNISNGAVGVYVDGGTANLGTTGNLTFNFGTGGGIGVYNNGGTLVLGNNITAVGSGSLAATVNGDLTSSGNLNIGEGGTGLLGSYDNATATDKNITNTSTGNITATSGGIGLAAIKAAGSNPSGTITINNAGTITVIGKANASSHSPSIGIYTDVAVINNTNTINVGTDGIGIYAADSGKAVTNNNMTMTGDNGIGVYIKGATGGLTANNITSIEGKRNTGVVLEGVTSNINAGTITLEDESIGIMATGTTSTIDGNITVGDSSTGKSAIGIVAKNSNLNLTGTTKITAGKGGIGIYAEGTSQVSDVDTSKITVGADGIYMYSTAGTSISFTGNITADNQIGIVVNKGTVTGAGSTLTAKNGGIGAYVKGTGSSFTGTNIIVQSGIAETGTDPAKYSVGVYYEDTGNIGTLPTVTQTGNYTIGTVLNKSTGSTAAGINIGTSGSNQVGVMAKGNSTFTVTSGGITVADGDSNIGIYGENSIINVTGNISVGAASSLTNSSIGVSLNDGSYTGTSGNLSVGNNSIGIYGTNMTGDISQTGTTMNVGDNGVGIYGSGTGDINLNMTTIGLGNNNSIGVYAKGMDVSATGDIGVGTNTSIGIVSEGNGNVTHNGAMTIADKGTNEGDTGSVGIYKLNGTGTVITTAGNSWTIGNNGYGIFVKQEGAESATITNGADMNLGTAAVGIYSSGANTVNNSGTITVGETDVNGEPNNSKNHLNSVGIYVTDGTTVNNTGTINVEHDFSVGIYGSGEGTHITNASGGIINVDKGGVGILVQNKAIAVNKGTITLGSTAGIYGATTVGMAAYSGASIINGSTGVINVLEGSGMVVGVGATLTNNGVINVTNGIGIEGAGEVINKGNIIITGSGTDVGNTGVGSAEVGSIKIESDGTVTINDKYVGIGGTLSTAGNLVVDGAYVDVTTGTPLFNAQSVSGEVNILPNFALTGNGISYKIEDFVNTAMGTITGNKLTPVTSPLFIAKVTDDGDLVIAKRPYADLTIGEQFDALDKGLDNILANSNGIGKDAEILKGLNAYLEGLPDYQFESEASRKIAETRGDIYSTIQGRMQDINKAFDNSFYELESSYNLTKDSSKYSVIYTDGDYKDPTLGIDDYDYKVMGLLYMKEKEGTEYGSKYGYTLGFTGSKFEFENDSKEDVYSLRAGVHRVKNLSEENKVSWLTRLELGYNRHITKRKLNLQETFENKGEYNTYSVALDNRVTKVIYTDLSRQLDIYADLDLEYGKIDGFTESAGSNGGLEVQIKDNDYLSAQLGAGVKASQRIYAGNDVSVKVTADVKYAYELGDNYDGNKARLKNGGEGYYSLITPDEREGKLIGKVGLTVEKANHMGVTFEVEAADEGNRKDSSVKYGVRFNYKF